MLRRFLDSSKSGQTVGIVNHIWRWNKPAGTSLSNIVILALCRNICNASTIQTVLVRLSIIRHCTTVVWIFILSVLIFPRLAPARIYKFHKRVVILGPECPDHPKRGLRVKSILAYGRLPPTDYLQSQVCDSNTNSFFFQKQYQGLCRNVCLVGTRKKSVV